MRGADNTYLCLQGQVFIDCCYELCYFSKLVVVGSPPKTMTSLALYSQVFSTGHIVHGFGSQPLRVISLLLPRGSQELNSGHLDHQKLFVSIKPFACPKICFKVLILIFLCTFKILVQLKGHPGIYITVSFENQSIFSFTLGHDCSAIGQSSDACQSCLCKEHGQIR